ncbi:MAG: DUF1178 family protein [Sphingomonadales bacterium]
MIVFDLRCASAGHVFEAWFGSTDDYEAQRERGLVECPLCGCQQIEKAVMAPRVGAKSNQLTRSDAPAALAGQPEMVKEMLAALARLQKKVIESSDYVGEHFADEARAIHLGEAAVRSIYGKATPAETESLLDEGICVAPLPFPVLLPGEEN